jgi:hypothetical protein
MALGAAQLLGAGVGAVGQRSRQGRVAQRNPSAAPARLRCVLGLSDSVDARSRRASPRQRAPRSKSTAWADSRAGSPGQARPDRAGLTRGSRTPDRQASQDLLSMNSTDPASLIVTEGVAARTALRRQFSRPGASRAQLNLAPGGVAWRSDSDSQHMTRRSVSTTRQAIQQPPATA